MNFWQAAKKILIESNEIQIQNFKVANKKNIRNKFIMVMRKIKIIICNLISNIQTSQTCVKKCKDFFFFFAEGRLVI
jgi:hypothetical protein